RFPALARERGRGRGPGGPARRRRSAGRQGRGRLARREAEVTTFPGSPRVLRGAIVVVDVDSSAVLRVIALQYNPDSLTRSFQVHAAGDDRAARLDPLRLRAPPAESFNLEAELVAAD